MIDRTTGTMLRIDLVPLREGVHHLELTPEAEDVGLDPDRFADLRVGVTLDLFNDQILVTLVASATATLECDRTLVSFEQVVEGTHRVLYASPSFARREEDDDDAYDEVRVLQDAERAIDLTEAVRDTVLLAVPTRKIAPGAEDVEIQTVFGAPDGYQAGIDPRWDALRQLRSDDDAA